MNSILSIIVSTSFIIYKIMKKSIKIKYFYKQSRKS